MIASFLLLALASAASAEVCLSAEESSKLGVPKVVLFQDGPATVPPSEPQPEAAVSTVTVVASSNDDDVSAMCREKCGENCVGLEDTSVCFGEEMDGDFTFLYLKKI